MKLRISAIAATLCFSAALAAPYCAAFTPATVAPTDTESVAAAISAKLLTEFHYRARPLDEAMSSNIYQHYLDALDPGHMVFTAADIAAMEPNRLKLSQAILDQDLRIPFSMFNLRSQRLAERLSAARRLLSLGFDFENNESFEPDRTASPWPRTASDADELWRKLIKNDWLRLKLAGQSDGAIMALLDKRCERGLLQLQKTDSEDAFEAFMNAYTMAVDPHTNYLGPRSARDFDIAMNLSLVGIGASMRDDLGIKTVTELMAGGPAALSGKLAVGDRIVGVAQGDEKKVTDVRGLRLDETVDLIRGAAGSMVSLEVIPVGAPLDSAPRRVTLARKKIELDDASAKLRMLTVSNGGLSHRIGVISLPSFYRDFSAQQRGERHVKSASDDVAHLLAQLKGMKAEGVLLDLRDNGGGSLTEAIRLSGLFIGKGPVLQERRADGKVVVDANTSVQLAWHGPLGVLINRNSASASEIFAAAIQDYGRGVIIGERSFGKGTVQTTIDLSEVTVDPQADLGELKMTIGQFFRVDGRTTQLAGVRPDVALAVPGQALPWGEQKFDNALPNSTVTPAHFVKDELASGVLGQLASLSAARLAASADFQRLLQHDRYLDQQEQANRVSLSERERRTEGAALNGDLAGQLSQKADGLGDDDGLEPDERAAPPRLDKSAAARDLVLQEAVQVVGDEAGLLSGPATASQNPLALRTRSDSIARQTN